MITYFLTFHSFTFHFFNSRARRFSSVILTEIAAYLSELWKIIKKSGCQIKLFRFTIVNQ